VQETNPVEQPRMLVDELVQLGRGPRASLLSAIGVPPEITSTEAAREPRTALSMLPRGFGAVGR
jgi:hypothetical protein